MTRRLLVNFARVGDLVMNTPILRHLAREGEVRLLARGFARPLLGGQPWLAGVATVRRPNRLGHWAGRLVDAGIEGLETAAVDEVLVFAGERPRVRRALARLLPQARLRILDGAREAGRHWSEHHRALLAASGFASDGYDPVARLDVLPAARERVAPLLSPLGRVVGLQIGSQRTATRSWWRRERPNLKSLALEQWARLAARVLREGHADTILCHGTAAEAGLVRDLRACLPDDLRGRLHDGCDHLPLDLLPAALAGHRALLSCDTGPAHIAAAVGCPLLVVFGASDPAYFAPRGPGPVEVVAGACPDGLPPCLGTARYKRCRDNRCLTGLADEVLWAGWQRLLTRIPPGASA